MLNTDPVWTAADAHAPDYITLADTVFHTPEVCYTEHRSAAAHRERLVAEGLCGTGWREGGRS
jgi:aminobenzoyl-glutamate utilization protein B